MSLCGLWCYGTSLGQDLAEGLGPGPAFSARSMADLAKHMGAPRRRIALLEEQLQLTHSIRRPLTYLDLLLHIHRPTLLTLFGELL